MAGGDNPKKSRVVVVGGGLGGALLAKNLQNDADVVLIDAKDYFEIPWARPRSTVEPPFADRALIKHTDYLKNGTIITACATGLTEKEVLTDSGQAVPYDYLVLAVGRAYEIPRTRVERIKEWQEDHKTLTAANSVLIIGGGPTGVELAGEIVTDFPNKSLTLVHRGSRLLEFIGEKAADKALNWLKSKKVEVILNEGIDTTNLPRDTKEFITSGGKIIRADCHFVCAGRPLATQWLKHTVVKDSIDPQGRVIVDQYLRVKGWKNIFAIGDITNLPEMKQGLIAQGHAGAVAKNLKLLVGGAPEGKLSAYKASGMAMAIVALGRREGVAQLPFATICGRIPGMIKSKDLFVGMCRKTMGV